MRELSEKRSYLGSELAKLYRQQYLPGLEFERRATLAEAKRNTIEHCFPGLQVKGENLSPAEARHLAAKECCKGLFESRKMLLELAEKREKLAAETVRRRGQFFSGSRGSFWALLERRKELQVLDQHYQEVALRCRQELAAFDSPSRQELVAKKAAQLLSQDQSRRELKAAAERRVRGLNKRIKFSLLVKRLVAKVPEQQIPVRLSALGQVVPRSFRGLKQQLAREQNLALRRGKELALER